MARKLPLQYQQRIPYELLSGLANCLLNETIFKIVEGLTEIQQVTEKQLLQQRLKLLHKQRGDFIPDSPYLYMVLHSIDAFIQRRKKHWPRNYQHQQFQGLIV